MAQQLTIHLMVPDENGTIKTFDNLNPVLGMGGPGGTDPPLSIGGRYRIACGWPMKWVTEGMHRATEEPMAIASDNPAHCAKCKATKEYLEHPNIKLDVTGPETPERSGQPEGTLADAGEAAKPCPSC